ncbi:HD-GYP domain-containing protein [Magnetococcales bacterium HHB-1]
MINKPSILIVDDTTVNIDILKELLSPFYRVLAATNGEIALKIANSAHPPDLILLDVMMPELDGYEVCRRLKAREQTAHIPIIFVTAKSNVDDETFGFSLGAADYIAKPISPPTVLARIRTHLALYDQKRHLESLVQERTQALLERTDELEETRVEVIRQLGRAAEFRDNETGMHVIRMSLYSRMLAEKWGMDEEESKQLMHAAMMHDVGKIGIPDHILLKPGRLTDREFAEIRKHPAIGAKIIGEQKASLLKLARVISLTHHEKWDGSGYPKGLEGEDIPIEGRIVSIADVFDALTSERPYKKAWPMVDALSLIYKESGKSFDPKLVPLFLSLESELKQVMEQYRDI